MLFPIIAVGDEVLVVRSSTYAQIAQVTHVTAQYVDAGNMRYRRDTGLQSPRSTFSTGNKRIMPLTDEKRAQLLMRDQREYLRGFDWLRVSPDALHEIARVLHKHGMTDMPRKKERPMQEYEDGRCDCGNPTQAHSTVCLSCKELSGTREFALGQKVRIIRRETWYGAICTITRKSHHNPNMYWLKEHGWRRCDEIEAL